MPEKRPRPHCIIVNTVSLKPETYDALLAQATQRNLRVGEVISEIVEADQANDNHDKEQVA